MALAKVTIEALTQMANILRQSADDILATKEQMDNELRSFPWDDPIGLNFINRYEEDFKPLKEKLIPNIEDYIQYMNQEGMIVSDYSGESIGGLGSVGAGVAGVASAIGAGSVFSGSQTLGRSATGTSGKKTEQKSINEYLAENKDGTISWNDERFKKLEKENADFLSTKEGKKLQKRAETAFSKVNDLSKLTRGQLHQVVGGTLGLSKDQISFDTKADQDINLLGWHPNISDEAILNENQRATMPVCEQIATFAHEGRHVYQDMVMNSDSKTAYAIDMRAARDSYSQDSRTFEGYYNNGLEKDARKLEIIVGKACTERHNKLIQMKLSKPRRWNPSDYYQK